jgi:ribosomal protein S27E
MIKKPICKECGSKQIMYLRRSKKYWCRVCGHEWEKEQSRNGAASK